MNILNCVHGGVDEQTPTTEIAKERSGDKRQTGQSDIRRSLRRKIDVKKKEYPGGICSPMILGFSEMVNVFSCLKRTDKGRGGSSEKGGGDTSAQSERTKVNETHHSHSESHSHPRFRDTRLPLLFCSSLHVSCSFFVFVSSHTSCINTQPKPENEET